MKAAIAAWRLVAAGALAGLWAGQAMGNAGPFVVRYPGGDVAAQGVLARLDPTLMPAREDRLRVVKEELTILGDDPVAPKRYFDGGPGYYEKGTPPLVAVEAAYTIENPAEDWITDDFGFPILRGIYLGSNAYYRRTTSVRVDGPDQVGGNVSPKVISDSLIYGIIRRDAREIIGQGIASDDELARRIAAVSTASLPIGTSQASEKPSPGSQAARDNLRAYLVSNLRWNVRDAALSVEYASLDLGGGPLVPNNRWPEKAEGDEKAVKLMSSNLGVLAAIGEQKATQFFAQLASCFDKKAATKYEAIFSAWGGDVRERSVDLASGQVRPRQYTLAPSDLQKPGIDTSDPTVYARVDYLDPDAKLTAREKSSCQAVLKNLPVVFTFAPMNLLRYRVTFPPGATCVVTVSYLQYMYIDDRKPASYQLAYVLHPASLWDHFGPIHLTIQVPKGIVCKASVPIQEGEIDRESARNVPNHTCYQATLTEAKDKMGELFIGIDKAAWDDMVPYRGIFQGWFLHGLVWSGVGVCVLTFLVCVRKWKSAAANATGRGVA